MTFPEAAQRLQKDDTTERQGDFVKQEAHSFREDERASQNEKC